MIKNRQRHTCDLHGGGVRTGSGTQRVSRGKETPWHMVA